MFTKEIYKTFNTVDKMNNYIERLKEYYLPCVKKIFS